MAQNGDLSQNPPPNGEKRAEHPKGHDAASTAASTKLYSEASKEWQRKAGDERKAPLSVPDGQNYAVKPGDCLSDIAARRLRGDHETVNSHTIAKEETRLRKLNSGDHTSLGSKNKRDRDLLKDGWNLKIYDSVHDKKSAPAAGRDTTAAEPPAKTDAHKPWVLSKSAADAIASKLTASDLQSDMNAPTSTEPKALRPVVTPVAPKPLEAKKQEAPRPAEVPIELPLPPRRPSFTAPGPTSDLPPDLQPLPEPKQAPRPAEAPIEPPLPPRRPAFKAPGAQSDLPPDLRPLPEPKQPERKPEPPARVEKPEAAKESPYGASPADMLDRSRFYTHQTNGWSCSAVALAMMHANEVSGHPPSPGEVQHFEQVTGTTSHGYRGSLSDMAAQARSQGMEAKAYQYGQFGSQGMNDLDRELAQGHSAVARIINPHTGNPHYIYIAGRDRNGNYEIGDPDRKNNANFGHDKPISRAHLLNMMSGRDGFVAGWS